MTGNRQFTDPPGVDDFFDAERVLRVTTERVDGESIVVTPSPEFRDRLGYEPGTVVGEPLATYCLAVPEGVPDRPVRLTLRTAENLPIRTLARVDREPDPPDGAARHHWTFVELPDGERSTYPVDRYEHLHEVIDDVDDCNTRAAVFRTLANGEFTLVSADATGAYRRDDGLIRVATAPETDPGLPDGPGLAGTPAEQAIERASPAVVPANELDAPGSSTADRRTVLCVPIDDHGVLLARLPGRDADAALDVEAALEFTEKLCRHGAKQLELLDAAETSRETNRRLLSLMSNVPGMVYRADVGDDRSVEFVTHECVELTGYAPTALQGDDVSWLDDVVHPADRDTVRESVRTALDDTELYRLVYRIITKEGVERWVWDNGGGLYEDDAPDIEGFVIDIDRWKQTEQRLDVLTRVLRHNVRNELSVIMQAAERIVPELDDEHAEWTGTIIDAAEQLDELSDKARRAQDVMTPGDGPDREQPVPDIVDRVVDRFADEHPDAEFVTRTEAVGESEIPRRLTFVLQELLENAVEHHDGSDPTIEVSVSVTRRNGEPWTEIAVADDGPGLPEHEIETLRSGTETGLQHGSGLGLWLVNWIVTSTGGILEFDENDPRGTIARVLFLHPSRQHTRATWESGGDLGNE